MAELILVSLPWLQNDGSRCSADASAKINGNEAILLVADGEGYMCWMAQKLLQ
jgi:hypothetical protein